MKAYVVVTATAFGLVAAVHVWRMIVEPSVMHDPGFLVITAVAATLSLWGWRAFLAARNP